MSMLPSFSELEHLIENYKIIICIFSIILVIALIYVWCGSIRNHKLIDSIIEWNKSLGLPMYIKVGWKGVEVLPILEGREKLPKGKYPKDTPKADNKSKQDTPQSL